jgi:hypothetical protein
MMPGIPTTSGRKAFTPAVLSYSRRKLPMKTLFALLLIVSLASIAMGQESSKEILSRAKTLHITAPEGPSLDLKAEAIKKLVKWGKLQIVSDPEKADLILRVELTRGYSAWKGKGARGGAELSDRQTSTVLWATSEGGDWSMSGYSSGRVGRKIADKFIKFYGSQLK